MDFVSEKLKMNLKGLPENYVVLLLSDSNNYLETNLALLKALTEDGDTVIFVTMIRPSEVLVKLFDQNGINKDKIYIIDCVSTLTEQYKKHTSHEVFVQPNNLSAIAMAINEMALRLEGKKVVVFDSPTTLMVYNTLNEIMKFALFVTSKIRLENLRGILLSVEEDMKTDILSNLSHVSDKVINLNK
jgi:KaiC/GvpD/RAD55 family RecA-like ATPase